MHTGIAFHGFLSGLLEAEEIIATDSEWDLHDSGVLVVPLYL